MTEIEKEPVVAVLKEYARQMIQVEELHAGEVDRMLRRPGTTATLPRQGMDHA
ncbi:hypothetical protein C7410_11753 [Paraburkholderia silvatlantica]|uniref:Uncharacterized protein n=1 Tax=Paraburkholderia silvatlantica TaxID=321895 RepID=A0A2V4TI51_9BURK|nr:hypothetical protein C7410_11753 [Paraburkholderia silvatlantica]TDQ85314.1 hypothetical protein C7412_11953 [Paraburkholderia silvatlantica]